MTHDGTHRRSRRLRSVCCSTVLALALMVPLLATPAGAQTVDELTPVEHTAVERAPGARTADSSTASMIERPAFTLVPCLRFTDSIVRLYSAYFLRAPDQGGFEFWEAEFLAGRWSLPRMSQFFSESPEFQQRYGALTDAQFIDLIYQNIFGRPADAGGRDFWLGRMQNEGLTRGTVMLNFSESPEYIELSGTVRSLAGDFNWYPEGAVFGCGFGNGQYSITSQPAWMDVIVTNFLDDPIQVRYEVLQAGTWTVVQDATLNPGGNLTAFGWALNNNIITAVRFTSTSTFSWSVAQSPSVTPAVRAGWTQVPA